MHEVLIREAVAADAAALARIYNHYVINSTVTFDEVPVSEQNRLEWLRERGTGHPVLVAESAGGVVGWGSLSPYRTRPAWNRTVEFGVYLDPDVVGRGIGSALTQALLQRAADIGHHVVVGQIVSDNVQSLSLARREGFVEIGVLREVGFKFGRYVDLTIVQKTL